MTTNEPRCRSCGWAERPGKNSVFFESPAQPIRETVQTVDGQERTEIVGWSSVLCTACAAQQRTNMAAMMVGALAQVDHEHGEDLE